MPIELQRVTFNSDGREIVGHLRLPAGYHANGRYPAVVVAGPGSSVKEQAGAVYASKLAAKGFLTLACRATWRTRRCASKISVVR